MAFFQHGVKTFDEKEINPDLQCSSGPVPALEDSSPSIWLFVNACFGFLWWWIQAFVYVDSDTTYSMKDDNQNDTLPFIWMWLNLTSTSYGWTAAAYFANFFGIAITHLIEFIGWFQYNDRTSMWVAWWIQYPGLYLNTILLTLPWLFIVFQLALPTTSGGMNNQYTDKTEFVQNAYFLLIMGLIVHVWSSLMHLIFAERFMFNAMAIEADLVEKLGAPCPVKRNFMMGDEEYAAACAAIKEVAEEKAAEEAERRAAFEAALEDELGEEIEFREDGWI